MFYIFFININDGFPGIISIVVVVVVVVVIVLVLVLVLVLLSSLTAHILLYEENFQHVL